MLEIKPDFDVVIAVEKAAITFYFSDEPGENICALFRSLIDSKKTILLDTAARNNCGEEIGHGNGNSRLCFRLKVSPVFDTFKLALNIKECLDKTFQLHTKLIRDSEVAAPALKIENRFSTQESVEQIYRVMNDVAKRVADIVINGERGR